MNHIGESLTLQLVCRYLQIAVRHLVTYSVIHQRKARTSPRRAPVAAQISRNVAMHHGEVADAKTRACCAGVSATPLRFFGTGGSLRVTGFLATNPHLSARAKALETRPATCLTVLALSGRACFVFLAITCGRRPPSTSATAHRFFEATPRNAPHRSG